MYMEIKIKEEVVIHKDDLLYVEMDLDGSNLFVCITQPDGSLQMPKAETWHRLTTEKIY